MNRLGTTVYVNTICLCRSPQKRNLRRTFTTFNTRFLQSSICDAPVIVHTIEAGLLHLLILRLNAPYTQQDNFHCSDFQNSLAFYIHELISIK